ncbi:MAG: BBP7 family outer membrane beta-barrel protein [Pirellulales bacterium]
MNQALPKPNLTSVVALGILAASISAGQAQVLDLRSAVSPASPTATPYSVRPAAANLQFVQNYPVSISDSAVNPVSHILPQASLSDMPIDTPGELMGSDYADGEYPDPDGEYVEDGWNIPGIPAAWIGCPSVRYAEVDALYMIRLGNRGATISAGSDSQQFRLGSFDYETGARATVGQKFDCLDGWELSWVGPIEWTMRGQLAGTSLDPLITAGSGVDLSAFQDATFHSQSYSSRLNSIEFMRKHWGWDVLTQSVGFRYVNIEEEFRLDSINGTGAAGLFVLDTNNHLFGLQYGFDLLYPFGDRWVFTSKGKIGGYVNLISGDLTLDNDGGYVQINDADEVELSLLGEWGTYLSCRISPNISARIGYEFWYVSGVALAYDQVQNVVTPASGRSIDSGGDLVYHGATGGIEVVW